MVKESVVGLGGKGEEWWWEGLEWGGVVVVVGMGKDLWWED